MGVKKVKRTEFILLGPPWDEHPEGSLPNTLMISIVAKMKPSGKKEKPADQITEQDIEPAFCNVSLKKMLHKNNVIISIGSACGTNDPRSSHVLHAIKAPEIIRRGVIRISLSDNSTVGEITKFVNILVKCVAAQAII